jgi:hypothetical protein
MNCSVERSAGYGRLFRFEVEIRGQSGGLAVEQTLNLTALPDLSTAVIGGSRGESEAGQNAIGK